jgi:N-acetylneuraminic acid mutarotase
VVFGGWGNPKKEALSAVTAYKPRSDSWRSLPALPTPTAAAGAATIRTRDGLTHLYVIGGLPNRTAVQEY